MLEYLVVRLVEAGSPGVDETQWVTLDAAGKLVDSGDGDLQSLGGFYGGLADKPSIVVLAPAREILLSSAEIPPGQQRYAKQALPFLIEEKLAEDIEDSHIAMGRVTRGQAVAVAVVRHSTIINWLDSLYSASLPPARLVSEALVLPWEEGHISVCIDEHCSLVRDGQYHGMGCDHDSVTLVLELLQRRMATEPGSLVVDLYYRQGDHRASALQEQLARVECASVQLHAYPCSTLSFLASQLVAEAPTSPDLLQGGYAVEGMAQSGHLNLRKVALTFAACVVVHLAVTSTTGLWCQWRTDTVRADAVAQYKQWFPAARRVFDPRRQLQSQLASVGRADSESLFAYIGGVSGSWDSQQGDLRVRSLDYQGGTALMTLELEGSSVASLNGLKQRLAEQGLRGELTSVSGRGDKVTGRLELGGIL